MNIHFLNYKTLFSVVFNKLKNNNSFVVTYLIKLVCLGITVCSTAIVSAIPHVYSDTPSSGIVINSATICTSPIIRNISIPDSYNIADVKLGFNADHAYRGDIQAVLESPAGTRITVMSSSGGDSNDNYDLELSDSSTSPINDGNIDNTAFPYYDRIASPSNLLAGFDGENSAGTWILEICDVYPSADDGTYNRAQLTLEEDVPIPGAPICGIRSDIQNNWGAGALSYNETNIDGSGVNMSVSVTGNTSPIVTIEGGTFNGVDGLDLRTNGFGGSGVTFTYSFTEDLASVDFNIGHINASGGAGDSFIITARDSLGNTVFPTFTTSGSSYTANAATGVVDATGATANNLGVNFVDADLITQVIIDWGDCSTCGVSFHGAAIGEMDICLPALPVLTLVKTVINDGTGTAVDTDFTLSFDNGAGDSGSGAEGDTAITSAIVPAGNYTLTESTLAAYNLDSIACDGNDTDGTDGLTLVNGENVTCTFTNNDQLIDLTITKTVSDPTPNIGDTVTFTLLVENLGPDTATAVSVTDSVPAGFLYTIATIAGGDSRNASGANLSWTINSLASTANTTLTFQAVVNEP